MTLCVRERPGHLHGLDDAEQAVIAREATDCEKCLAWANDLD